MQDTVLGPRRIVRCIYLLSFVLTDFSCCTLAPLNSVKAQIVPDNTLGAERSVVVPNVQIQDIPVARIDGGAIRGANLFHSFSDFNVEEGRGAYFTNPAGIENIVSRVTGSNPSNILGKLGVLGNANLFLINPNGIIFGRNASLDIGGSFVGTTANAIGLASGDIFSANPGEPLPTALLNVNPNAFLFNQIATGAIINRSRGLEVPEGRSLLLVGGDVSLDGGRIQAPGGRVELGGLASPGRIGLAMNGSQGYLSFPNGVAQADAYLTSSSSNTAGVNGAAISGRSIAITARNIDILSSSVVAGEIERDLGFSGAGAANIRLSAMGAILLLNGNITANATSTANGNIAITTHILTALENSSITANAAPHRDGNAGIFTSCQLKLMIA